MRVVLYTKDLEPITILEIPVWLLETLEKHGCAKLAVAEPLQAVLNKDFNDIKPPTTLDIYCERLKWRDGSLKTILLTSNDELALALKPEWLPGQQQAINWYEKIIRQLVQELELHFKKKNLD